MRIVLSLALLTGCVVHPLVGHDDDDNTDPTDVPPPPVADGVYQVRTAVDLTLEVVLPEPAEQLVVTLRAFSTAPAHTLIDLADQAGVPAVAELRAALPDALERKLEGWIDDEIATLTIGGVPVTQLAGETAALAETALTQVALDSELAITGGTATHRLTRLDFTPAGLDTALAVGELPGDLVSATMPVSSANGRLAIGDHRFGLAYGEYAWRALEAACTKTYGQDLRATLGAAVGCPALAATIASKCVLGVCVGHASQLTAICEAGLDEVVDRAAAKLTGLRFDAVHLAAGTAAIADRGARLDGGAWTAEINAGLGLRHAPATFTATR